MSRFFVPAVFVALISGLGLGLIVGIVARSPETHSNVRPEGYDRAPISYVGEPVPFSGVGLTPPGLAEAVEPMDRGRLLFFAHGCATCHGITGQGGVIGPDLDLQQAEIWLEDFAPILRSGPGGMPAFSERVIGDDELAAIYTYLKAIRQATTLPTAAP